MADKKISELNLHTSPALSDSFATVNGGETKKVLLGALNETIRNSNTPLTASGITVSGDIVPTTPQVGTLGTLEKPFREIYLQSGSISIESDTPGEPRATISNFNGNVDIQAAGFSITSGSISPFILNNEGQITIQNAFQDPENEAILQIIGNNEGNIQAAVNPGSLVHVTGFDGITNRSVFDSYGGGGVFSQLILRNANGTAANPTSTVAGIIGRVATSGYITGTGFGIEGVTGPPASMNFYTPGYRSGSRETMIRFYATADNELDPTGYSAVIKAEGMEITGSLDISGSITADLQENYMWLGDSNNRSNPVSLDTLAESGSFVRSAHISLYSSASQQLAVSGAAQPATFTSVWTQNGITLESGSKLVMEKAGTYQFNFVAQVTNPANAIHDSYFWIKYNGNNFPNSSTKMSVPVRKNETTPSAQLMTVNIVGVAQNDNDYIELYWTGDSTTIQLTESPATEIIPETPSVIANIIRIR